MAQHNKKVFLLLIASLSIGAWAFSQQSVTAAGGDASGSGGSAAYSIGQVAYTTIAGSNGSVAQGVQQAYEISSVGIAENGFDGIALKIFPNPTADLLTLQVDDLGTEALGYELFDNHGQRLWSGLVETSHTPIDLRGFAAGTYYLNIVQEGKQLRSFKVIKNY